MTGLSLREVLSAGAATRKKVWAHDRDETVGASEIGQCLRKLSYMKLGIPRDADYVERRGAMDRGDLIEMHYWEPALRAGLPAGVQILYSGDDQRTLKDGYLSATPDGLLVGLPRDCLAEMGIPDIGEAGELLVECKSIDPRVDLHEEKEEHQFQCRQQLGLMRATTNHRPEYALLSYVNCSFLDDVEEFPIRHSDVVYEHGKIRARDVMRCRDPLQLTAEGKRDGGKECGYCPWRSQCFAAISAAVPTGDTALSEADMITCSELVFAERRSAASADALETLHRAASEDLKQFLREKKTRRVKGDTFSVSYNPIKGRSSVDLEAMAEAGIDLEPYRRQGDPGERLTVKLNQKG